MDLTPLLFEGDDAKNKQKILSSKAMYILKSMMNQENHLYIQDIEVLKQA